MNRKNGRGKREKIFGDFPVSRKDKDQSERGKVRWVYERQKKDNSELFKWDGKPSAGQVFPLAAQRCACGGSRMCDAGNFGCKCGE